MAMTTPRDDIAGLIKRLREESEYLAEEVGVQFTLLISENEALKAALIRAEQERDSLNKELAQTQAHLGMRNCDLAEAIRERDALQARVKELEADLRIARYKVDAHSRLLVEAESRAIRAEQERDEAYEERDSLVRDYQRVNAQLAEEMKARGHTEQERDEAYERAAKVAESEWQNWQTYGKDFDGMTSCKEVAVAIRRLAGPEKEKKE